MAQNDLTQQDKANLRSALNANGGVTAREGYDLIDGSRRNGSLTPQDVLNFLKKEGRALSWNGKPWKRRRARVYGKKLAPRVDTTFIAESAKKYD